MELVAAAGLLIAIAAWFAVRALTRARRRMDRIFREELRNPDRDES